MRKSSSRRTPAATVSGETALPDRVLRRAWMFPNRVVQGYLLLTVLLFFFGPWPWPVANVPLLVVYLVLAQVLLYAGYVTAKWRTAPGYRGPISAERLTKIFIIGTLVSVPLTLSSRSAEIRAGRGVIESIVASAGDMRSAQATMRAQLREKGEGISQRYVILPSVMCAMALPLGIVFWNRLSVGWRVVFVLSRVGDLSTWLITGTTKGIADTFTVGALMVVVYHPGLVGQLRKNWLRLVVFALVCGWVVLQYFGQAKFGDRIPSGMTDFGIGISADFDNPLLSPLGPRPRAVGVLLCNYLTQGYYALGEALALPFEWTYGLGHGRLSSGLAELLGMAGIEDRSYPGRLYAVGWDPDRRWQTLYVWLASDLTFPGTLLAVLLLGRLLALAWRDALERENPFGVVMAFLFLQMAIYIPANNQVLSFETSAVTFWVCLPLWLWTRRRTAGRKRSTPQPVYS